MNHEGVINSMIFHSSFPMCFLNNLLKEGGKVLIHIPNPYHSDWWRALDRPMQIIDLSVHLPIVIENLKNTGLHITFLEIYSVWSLNGPMWFIVLI